PRRAARNVFEVDLRDSARGDAQRRRAALPRLIQRFRFAATQALGEIARADPVRTLPVAVGTWRRAHGTGAAAANEIAEADVVVARCRGRQHRQAPVQTVAEAQLRAF